MGLRAEIFGIWQPSASHCCNGSLKAAPHRFLCHAQFAGDLKDLLALDEPCYQYRALGCGDAAHKGFDSAALLPSIHLLEGLAGIDVSPSGSNKLSKGQERDGPPPRSP